MTSNPLIYEKDTDKQKQVDLQQKRLLFKELNLSFQGKDLEKISHILSDLLQDFPNDRNLLSSLAKLQYLSGKYIKSKSNFQKATEIFDRSQLDPNLFYDEDMFLYCLSCFKVGAIQHSQKIMYSYLKQRHKLLNKILNSFDLSYLSLNKPDFLLIGGQKCASTSLASYLDSHPLISLSVSKELHFFNRNFSKGLNFYSSRWQSKSKENLKFEATPNYLDYPFAAELIKKLFPDIKIILIIREPLERLNSHYAHNINANNRQYFINNFRIREFRSFKDALMDELNILEAFNPECLTNYKYHSSELGYISRGLYKLHFQQYQKHFSEKNLLIITLNDLKSNSQKVLDKCFDFLNVEKIQVNVDQIKNKTAKSDYLSDLDEYTIEHLKFFFDYWNKGFNSFIFKV